MFIKRQLCCPSKTLFEIVKQIFYLKRISILYIVVRLSTNNNNKKKNNVFMFSWVCVLFYGLLKEKKILALSAANRASQLWRWAWFWRWSIGSGFTLFVQLRSCLSDEATSLCSIMCNLFPGLWWHVLNSGFNVVLITFLLTTFGAISKLKFSIKDFLW